MPGRKIISNTGKSLLEGAEKKKFKLSIKKVLSNMFNSKYDIELNEKKNTLRESTCKLMSMIDDMDSINDKCKIAINNLVLIILTNDNEKINIQRVKYNLGFYLNLAKKAMDSDDHQTALLIKLAVDNNNIKRLKINYNKSMTRTYNELELKYGSFKNMNKNHLNDILKNGFLYFR